MPDTNRDDNNQLHARSQPPHQHANGLRQAAPLHMLPVVTRNGIAHNAVTRHCWEVVQSPDNDLQGRCEECYAYFVQRDCWSLWALREAGHKPCCQKLEDCTRCPVLLRQVAAQPDETVHVRAHMPLKPAPLPGGRSKQVCRYLDVMDIPVSPESAQYLSAVSRAVQARNATFRCRLRGVHLDVGYVGDMCVSRHVQDCVFLEEAQPHMDMQGPVPCGVEKAPDGVDEPAVPAAAARRPAP